MHDEKIADLIQLAERETLEFQDFEGSTLAGWFPKTDAEGRPLNADPNEQWSVFEYENTFAKAVRKEWLVKLYVSSKQITLEEAMLRTNENWTEVASLDLKPSYLVIN